LKSSALIVAKPPQYLSSLRKANQSTVERASLNTCSSDQKLPVRISVSTRNKRGHDAEITGREERNRNRLDFSNSSNQLPAGNDV
jgi:hypothetical protein